MLSKRACLLCLFGQLAEQKLITKQVLDKGDKETYFELLLPSTLHTWLVEQGKVSRPGQHKRCCGKTVI